MPKIDVDDEVYQRLQELATPFVDTENDVLRRVLQLDAAPVALKRRPGGLLRLVQAGKVKGGDRLTHHRKRSGTTYHAFVAADGWVEHPDGTPFPAPSPALKKHIGTEMDGWAGWTHDRSGKTLRELRAEL